jgi:hypothetical protein
VVTHQLSPPPLDVVERKLDDMSRRHWELNTKIKKVETKKIGSDEQVKLLFIKWTSCCQWDLKKYSHPRTSSIVYLKPQLKKLFVELASVKQQLQETHQLRKENGDLEVQLYLARESTSAMVKQLEQCEGQLSSLVEENNKLKTEKLSFLQTQEVADMDLLRDKLEANQSKLVKDDEMVRIDFRLFLFVHTVSLVACCLTAWLFICGSFETWNKSWQKLEQSN